MDRYFVDGPRRVVANRGHLSIMNLAPFVSFEEIPFIDHSKAYGRTLCTLTFYVGSQWHLWTLLEDGRFLRIPIVSMAEGFYFGDKEADVDDIYFKFWDFLAQRGNILDLRQQINGLSDDFLNLAASVAKIDFLHSMQNHPDITKGIRRMVGTEIEYIFSVCRSIFDMLQEYIRKLWDTMDEPSDAAFKKQSIPKSKSFYGMAYENNTVIDPAGLQKKYGIPLPLAEYYARVAPFLENIRKIRDNIVHNGSTLPPIFPTEKGFAISDKFFPFANFGIWKEEDKQPNGLASIRPIIGYVIHQTIAACEEFVLVIQQCAPFPESLAPGLRMYMKGNFLGNLMGTANSLKGDPWWPKILETQKSG